MWHISGCPINDTIQHSFDLKQDTNDPWSPTGEAPNYRMQLKPNFVVRTSFSIHTDACYYFGNNANVSFPIANFSIHVGYSKDCVLTL